MPRFLWTEVPGSGKDFSEYLQASIGVGRGSRVLVLGADKEGLIPQALSSMVERVTVVDRDEERLNRARANWPAEVEGVVEDWEVYLSELRDRGGVDLIVAKNAIHYPGGGRIVAHAFEALNVGGRAIFSVPSIVESIGERRLRSAGVPVAKKERIELRRGVGNLLSGQTVYVVEKEEARQI